MRIAYILVFIGLSLTGCKQGDSDKANAPAAATELPNAVAPGSAPTAMATETAPDAASASNTATNGSQPEPPKNAIPSRIETNGRFSIKSGYVEMVSNVTNGEFRVDYATKKTFDNYGRDEKMDINIETVAGSDKKASEQHSIRRSGWLYQLHPESYIASRSQPATSFDFNNQEFSLLDADAMHQYNITNKGTEMVDGKSCVRYDINYRTGDNTYQGTFWVYKNILYKEDININGGNMHAQVTRLDENITVDQHLFDIPEGYRVIDADAE